MENYRWEKTKEILSNVKEKTELELITSDREFQQLENELEIAEDAALKVIASLEDPERTILLQHTDLLHKMIYERSTLNYAAGLKDHDHLLDDLILI